MTHVELLVLDWIKYEPGIRMKHLTERVGYGVTSSEIRSAVMSLVEQGLVGWNDDYRLYVKFDTCGGQVDEDKI
jgi:DNA-binding IclR family transcriptional regulator